MSIRCMFVFLMAAPVAAGGCSGGDGEVERTADFESMSSEQLRSVIEATSGAGGGSAYVAMLGGEIDAVLSDNACPTRDYGGDTMTLTADDCVAVSGTRYDGQLVATNAITVRDISSENPMVDPNRPMSIELHAFSVSGDGGAITFDGRIDQSSPTAMSYETTTALAFTTAAGVAEEAMTSSCSGRGEDDYVCDIERAWFSIEGLGSFTAEGTFGRAGGKPVGAFDIRGLQRLRVAVAGDSCFSFEIGDSGTDRGEICWD